MTFSFHAAGTKEQVRDQINAAEQKQRDWNSHTPLLHRIFNLIGDHLNHSNYENGVYVEASGHHDAAYGSLNLTIKPLNIPAASTDKPKDEPDGDAAE